MKIRVYTEEQQPLSNWSGGKTRELAVFPTDSAYLDRDFIWRLSTATSDVEESSFSRLEGFERILMLLEGDVVLAHGQERSVHLAEMEQDRFDGGVKTRCFGKLIEDYNLIMAKGCEGSIEVIELTQDAKAMDPVEESGGYRSWGAYCLEGYAIVSCGERSEMIRPGTQAVIDLDPGEDMIPTIMGEGRCVLARIAFEAGGSDISENAQAGTCTDGGADTARDTGSGSEGGAPQSRASFASEYGICLSLLFRNNRWSKMMRREGADKVYYDRTLSKALAKIERRYITTILWAAGCALCILPAGVMGRTGLAFATAALFTCLHLFLIAPFIYWRALPSPVRAHMKSTDELNALEKLHHQEAIGEDPHFDRLMKKYRSNDENYFADDSSPLYRLVKKK